MNPRHLALLAFLAITVATAIAVLIAAIGWLPHADPKLVAWGIPAVLGEIVATVILYVKAPPSHTIRINLAFEAEEAAGIDLDTSATYMVLDNSGREKIRGTVVPILGPGGYQVTLPSAVDAEDSVSLSFQEREGAVWDVRPFLPYVQTQPAIRGQSGGRGE